MSKGRAATLSELMGKGFSQGKGRNLTVDDLESLLGERMPHMEFNSVGRIRLIHALKNRFGDGYRNLPGIGDIMKDFDDMAAHKVNVEKMKQIRMKK